VSFLFAARAYSGAGFAASLSHAYLLAPGLTPIA
jgi:hypothetical protein